MLKSLFFHPAVVTTLWSQSILGARQPARRDFALGDLALEDGIVALEPSETALSPFYNLLEFAPRFDRSGETAPDRAVLIVPPMSGAFPFITRDMVARLARDARVFVIEWLNARMIPGAAGAFDLDDQIDAIETAQRAISARSANGRVHVLALCQGGPPALSAAAAAAERNAPPASLTLIGAPIEPRVRASMISASLCEHDLGWYRHRLIERRMPSTDGRRLVYPAETQLSLLYSVLSKQDYEQDELSRMILRDEGLDPAGASFIELVTSLMDIPAEHFLQNIERVYLTEAPAAERLRHRGRLLDFSALARTPMISIEGENDQVAAPGQTAAALEMCPAAPGVARRAAVIEGAGHFSLFYGVRWREQVAPRILALISHAERLAQDEERGSSDERPGDEVDTAPPGRSMQASA